MTTIYQYKQYLITIIGSVVPAFFVYSILSYLFIEPKITIPLSISISILIFGLTRYYDNIDNQTIEKRDGIYAKDINQNDIQNRNHKNRRGSLSVFTFVTIFAILIFISSLSFKQDFQIFVPWNEIGVTGIIQLGSAIMLCFFIPGYGIVLILSRKDKINPIIAVLLAYLLSMLITGLTAYISALSFDIPISQGKFLFTGAYMIILVSVVIFYSWHTIKSPFNVQTLYGYHQFVSKMTNSFSKYVRIRVYELLVFGTVFMFVIVSTYVLYGGITIGDQWFHQGRALLFMSGSIREAVMSGAETLYYPPFQSALLAALASLSGIPLVNSYASIAFLNAMAIFAFYYFFVSWVPSSMRKAAPIAVSLFTLSSGFGWVYLLGTLAADPILSPHLSLMTLRTMGHLDIVSASNFMLGTGPDFSTGLMYIALPAGFVLLALVRTRIHTNELVNISVVAAISLLGIISHYEFYIFIIIAAILPPIFMMKSKSFLYFSILVAISLVYVMDITVPGNSYTSLKILGFPLLFLAALFVMIAWAIYLAVGYLGRSLESRLFFSKLRNHHYHNKRFNFASRTVIIFLVAYLYLLSLVVLGQLSLDTTRDHTSEGTIPWYLYPMKLGVAGFLGIAFVLSYIFKRFEREVFIFGIIIIISLITGPYYNEGRFSKYIMVGVIGLASLMIYKLLNRRLGNKPIPNIILIGLIIPSIGLSVLIFTGYNSLILQTQDYIDTLPRRHFPSLSELRMFEALYDMANPDSNYYNVISFSNQYDRWKDGVMAKVPSFAGLPYDKVRQSPLTLNASTVDAFYRHLDHADSRFIIVPKDGVQSKNGISQPTRFAIDYFKRSYEDENYIILEAPPIYAPNANQETDVALVYDESKESSMADSNAEYYNFYFPLNILALSKAKYDIFKDNDLSVFSKKIIIVPDALKIDNHTLNMYKEYVRTGGTLVVINSDNNFSGTFSRLFSIHSNESNTESFTSIVGSNNQNVSVKVPGLVKKINMKSIPDTKEIASYQDNNNQTVAPFAIEKTYPTGGKIVLINADGYFKTISKSPTPQYFHSLSDILKLSGIYYDKVTTANNTSLPMKGFIGDMKVSGKVTVNSSSLTFPDEDVSPQILNPSTIKIFDKTNNSIVTFDNELIKSLKLVGNYQVIINLSGKMELPDMISHDNYFSMKIPNGFNMTVLLYPEKNTFMEIANESNSLIKPIRVNGSSKIDFYNINAGSPLKSVSLLLKNPEMIINGQTNIKNAYFNGYLNGRGGLEKGSTLNFQGKLQTKFDFVDHYNEPYRKGTSTSYITYLQSVMMNGSEEKKQERILIPGDISADAKMKGEYIPVEKILKSPSNLITLAALIAVTVIMTLLIRRYEYRFS